MKSMIVYASRHHGNTAKLVRYLSDRYGIVLMDAQAAQTLADEKYDLIGFASGIDFGKFYPEVTALAKKLSPGKGIYALYTCAKDQAKYGSEIEEIARQRGCRYLGKYGCKGYNTYGPLKIIGGMNKAHPDAEELEKACVFYEQIMSDFSGGEKERLYDLQNSEKVGRI